MRALVALWLLVAVAPAPSFAQWPAWRGGEANAVAPGGDYPVEFGPGKNELWSVDLPGQGTSTPVVWGDSIFVTAVDEERNLLCCYGLDGQERWRRELDEKSIAKHRNATGANPSPVVDAKHVVAYFKSGQLCCFNHDGEPLWDENLQDRYGENTLWWDLGSSPVLTSAGVCVVVMQTGDSFLVTLDLETGAEVWKTDRMYDRPKESDQSYTTPAVVWVDGRETLVTWGADHLTGHDARTGELVWEKDGFNPNNEVFWRVIASPAVANGVAYVPYGRGKNLAAVRLGSAPEMIWNQHTAGADVPCPVAHEGSLYVLEDSGKVFCLDARTGDEHWSKRLPRGRGKYYSSPVLAAGRLYCVREDGVAFVASVADGFQLLAENELGDDTVSTPVPVDGTLLMRTRTKLFRFGGG